MKLLNRVQLFATPWTVAHQAPLSMGFSRQEYWSGLPSLGIFLTQGSNPGLPHWRQMLYPLSHQGSPTPPLPRCQCSKESIDIPTSSSINGLAFLGTDSRAGPRLVSTLNPLCLGIPKLVIATQFFPDLLVQWLAAHRTLRRGLELGQH